jgi:hypothetical protein
MAYSARPYKSISNRCLPPLPDGIALYVEFRIAAIGCPGQAFPVPGTQLSGVAFHARNYDLDLWHTSNRDRRAFDDVPKLTSF